MMRVNFFRGLGAFVLLFSISASAEPIIRCDLLHRLDSSNPNSPVSFVRSQIVKGLRNISIQVAVTDDISVLVNSSREAGVLDFGVKVVESSAIKMEDVKSQPFESAKVDLNPLVSGASQPGSKQKVDSLDGSKRLEVSGPSVFYSNPNSISTGKSSIRLVCTTVSADSLALYIAERLLNFEQRMLKLEAQLSQRAPR